MTNGKTGKQEDYSRSSPHRVAELLSGIIDNDVPEEMKTKLRRWFRSSASQTEKGKILQHWFDTMQENRHPNEYDYLTLGRIHKILDFPEEGRIPVPTTNKVPLKKRGIERIAAVVIPAILILGSVLLWFKRGSDTLEAPPVDIESVYTAANQQKHIFLPDSSEIWLNEASWLTYPEDFLSNRRVRLSGEAYFSVREYETAPFAVETDEMVVTVLSTEFNVEAYAYKPNTAVTLFSGSISVEAGRQHYALKPGDRLVRGKHDKSVKVHAEGVVQSSWRKGIYFNDSPLVSVLEAIACYFDMGLEIYGELANDHIRFGFDHESSPELLLPVLHRIHQNFSYEIKEGKILITAY